MLFKIQELFAKTNVVVYHITVTPVHCLNTYDS